MKICIVTVYDSINCGSFLQAYILGKKCEEIGYDVYYLKRSLKERIKLNLLHIKKAINLFIKNGINSFQQKRKIDKDFKKFQRKLQLIDKNKMNTMDAIIIGSDTLWNINSKYFKDNYKLYFGGDYPHIKTITYAISAANSKIEDIIKLPKIKKYVENFYAISVRDELTKSIAENISNKNVKLVCDPTIMFSKRDYKKFVGNRIESRNYIYLYLFDDLSIDQVDNLKKFAIDNNCIIIDGNNDKKWSHISVLNTPNIFLNYMYYANFVITDTFHGTIFSTIFNKNYIVINRNKKKVNDFLEKCKLSNRLINNQNIDKVLNIDIDYETVNKIVDDYRKESIKYLNDSLK